MASDKAKRQRRSIRLKAADYAAPGAYFVTICAARRACVFGEVAGEAVLYSEIGQIVAEEWLATPTLRPYVSLDAWVLIPNHFHGIVVIHDHDEYPEVGAHGRAPLQTGMGSRPQSLSAIIQNFKGVVGKRVNLLRGQKGPSIWQRNYCERIVRNRGEMAAIREYIANNPIWWPRDRDHPDQMEG